MNHLIIRTFEKDDYLARLCLESWNLAGYKGSVMFWSEDYETKYLKGKTIYKRPPVDNFMGQLGVNSMIRSLKTTEINDSDIVIMCDADIVIKSNPLDGDYDIKGVGAEIKEWGFHHYNGECIIISGSFANMVKRLTTEDIRRIIWDELIGEIDCPVSDGHFFGYLARIHKLKELKCDNNWVHEKLYQYNGRKDYKEVINEVKLKYPNVR